MESPFNDLVKRLPIIEDYMKIVEENYLIIR